jgi:hypothetical protein
LADPSLSANTSACCPGTAKPTVCMARRAGKRGAKKVLVATAAFLAGGPSALQPKERRLQRGAA